MSADDNIIYRGFHIRKGVGEVWGVFRKGQLIGTRRSDQEAMAWIDETLRRWTADTHQGEQRQ